MTSRLGRVACAVAAAAALWGCSVDLPQVERRREALARDGADAVRRDLVAAIGRADVALAGVGAALERGASDEATRFEALREVAAAAGVDGLAWEGPGGDAVWAGLPVEPPSLPAPSPWDGSFRVADVTWHRGPFQRALVVGPVPVRGGVASATVVVEDRRPGSVDRPFERRWLDPLGLGAVEVDRPDRAVETPPGSVRATVERPGGPPLLALTVTPPGSDAVAERLVRVRDETVGLALVAAVALGVFLLHRLVVRRLRTERARLAGVAGLALLAREALALVDIGGRFPGLSRAFSPGDFGVDDPLGWFATPGDFALTALTAVVLAACVERWVGAVTRAGRPARAWAFFAGGAAAAAGVGALWARAVELAVAESQTPYFAAASFVPPWPAALMLGGLVALTGAAWLLASAAVRVAVANAPPLRRPFVRAVLAAAAGAAAWALAGPAVRGAAALLPVLAAVLASVRPVSGPTAAPSRILLVSVLSVALLFPILWALVGERRAQDLGSTLDTLLRHESAAAAATQTDLAATAGDPYLKRALREARDGKYPEGVALHVWLGSFLSSPGAHGSVVVLDDRARFLEEFSLTPLPRDRVPAPRFPLEDRNDVQVVRSRGDRGMLRCVVGRLRVRDDDGSVLGAVVMTVPDPIDLEIAGLGSLVEATIGRAMPTDSSRFPLQFAVLENGAVVASSDPTVSHRRGGLGPPEMALLSAKNPELAWTEAGREGRAVWSEDRGGAVAVQRRRADSGDLVIALARLVVVGVGLGGLAALVALALGLPRFRLRLHHRILLSYFLISVVPLALLGGASAGEARARHEANLAGRLTRDIERVRRDLELMGPGVFDQSDDDFLMREALQRGHDVFLYRDGRVVSSSRAGLVTAGVLPERLPAEAYRAAAIERRETVRREASFAGRPVWFGYAPVVDGSDRAIAVVGVPLLYDKDRIEEDLAVTGSTLTAAYLLTLVLVLVGGIYAAKNLARPLDALSQGTRRVAEGNLDLTLSGEGKDELGQLVAAFNAMTRDLRRAAEQTARVEREGAWRRMARQVAHEIKNPLTPMRLMIQQMQADLARDPKGAADSVRRASAVVLKQIEALGKIAGDFANFARAPRRTIRDVDVGALVREVTDLYSGSARDGIQVACVAPGDLPRVRWDEEELRRVLVNLVGNAVQAIRGAGAVTVRAEDESRDGEAGVTVHVADTGVGIPRENMERLFEPDFSTKTSGTGLGLAIVRGILDDMGGEITVESETGHGSTFHVWWPQRPDEA